MRRATRSRVDAQLLGSLAAFERSGAWEVDAAASVTSWLTAQTGVARPVAGARVRLARYLALMPVTSAALADGDITESHARVLSRCVANPRVRAYFTVDEVELVVDAMEMTADELSRRVDQWIELMDEDGAEPHAPERDVVRANRVGDRVKIDGDLGGDLPLRYPSPRHAARADRRHGRAHRRARALPVRQPLPEPGPRRQRGGAVPGARAAVRER